MKPASAAHRHAERLNEAFQSVHILAGLLTPPSSHTVYRAVVNRHLRHLRGLIREGVPCKSDTFEGVNEVAKCYLYNRAASWLGDVQDRPNPLRALFMDYLRSGYIGLNAPIPAGQEPKGLPGITYFDYAVRFARDPAVVPFLIKHGADERLVRTDLTNHGDAAVTVDFPSFVERCVRSRALFGAKPNEVADEAARFRAAALEALITREIQRCTSIQTTPAPDAPRRRTLSV